MLSMVTGTKYKKVKAFSPTGSEVKENKKRTPDLQWRVGRTGIVGGARVDHIFK